MIFEKGQISEVSISDGEYTIGYVDGKPAEWDGDMEELIEGDAYDYRDEGGTFDVNYRDEFIVEDGKWCKRCDLERNQ